MIGIRRVSMKKTILTVMVLAILVLAGCGSGSIEISSGGSDTETSTDETTVRFGEAKMGEARFN